MVLYGWILYDSGNDNNGGKYHVIGGSWRPFDSAVKMIVACLKKTKYFFFRVKNSLYSYYMEKRN